MGNKKCPKQRRCKTVSCSSSSSSSSSCSSQSGSWRRDTSCSNGLVNDPFQKIVVTTKPKVNVESCGKCTKIVKIWCEANVRKFKREPCKRRRVCKRRACSTTSC